MKKLRVVYAIARADFLERVRRYSYLVTLLFAVYLGYAAGTGQISLRLGNYRGLYTSAWIGAMVSLVTTTFVSLVGFYIVKNVVDRDRQTGVGEILAATPLSKASYLLGKFLSNFVVLLSMVVVLAIAAMAIQLLAAEDPSFHAAALLLPFLFLTLPAIAITAVIALLFETLSFLRGGLGNVVWFFLWSIGIALPAMTGIPQLDPSGLWLVSESMVSAARAGIPGYNGGFSLTIGRLIPVQLASGFHWTGVEWTGEVLLLRLAWIAVALALVLCGTLFFDRFDPAISRRKLGAPSRAKEDAAQPAMALDLLASRPAATSAPLTPLAPGALRGGVARLLVAELQLALKGYRWWWYAAAGGLLIAQLAAPLEVSCGPLLAVAWVWPIFVWSALGTREARFGVEQLLFSCARILPRQLPAAWLAGVLVAVLTGLGAAVRLALAGRSAGLFAWAAGVVFIPSLALALGVWSGTSKFFEGLYIALWYVGPLNRVPGFDFTGNANGPQTEPFAIMYLCIAVALVAAAFFRRARQLRGT
jgi:hypothetical protein